MGIDIRDPDQPVGTLSGGERQSVAIAQAVHFGARLLILDEPTSALGVKQAGVVLKYIAQARNRGDWGHLHHPQPAPRLPGRQPLPDPEPRPARWARFAKEEISLDELTRLMAGGAELDAARARAANGHQPALIRDAPPWRRVGGSGSVWSGSDGWARRIPDRRRGSPRCSPSGPSTPISSLCADNVPASREKSGRRVRVPARRPTTGRRSSSTPTSTSSTSTAPNMMHEPVAVAAAEAGKAVFCEKPVGGTPAQTVRIAAAASRAGRGHGRRVQLPLGAARAVRQAADRLGPARRDHELSRPVLLDVRRRPDGSAVVALPRRRGRPRCVVATSSATPSTWPRCWSGRSSSVTGTMETFIKERPLAQGGRLALRRRPAG